MTMNTETTHGRPGGISIDMMRAILGRPMPAVVSAAEVDGDPFPAFDGKTWDECITAFREANVAKQKNYWKQAAIAFRVERGVGGRPKNDGSESARKADTAIQRFCKAVGIGRNTFQRLSCTYGVFAGTRTTGGTSLMTKLSFKHFEVSARLTDTPLEAMNAVDFAHSAKWSANMLEQMLTLTADRPKPDQMNRWFGCRNPPLRMKKFLENFFRGLERTIDLWPVEMRRRVPYLLWKLAEHVKGTLPPIVASVETTSGAEAPDGSDLPACLRDLVVADSNDPIGEHDVEEIQ